MKGKFLFVNIRYILSAFFFLSLSTCIPNIDYISLTDEVPVATETITKPTRIAGTTIAMQKTGTPISVPTNTITTSPTIIIIPSPTSVPIATPTLTNEIRAQNLAKLMQTNGGCDLPCWWGVTPTETSTETAKESLITKGFQWGKDNYTGRLLTNDFGVFLEFDIQNDVIQSIHVQGSFPTEEDDSLVYSKAFVRGWQSYSLKEILDRYGLPSQVFAYIPFRADPGSGPSYHLLVFYEQLGVEIDYRGYAVQLNKGYYRACPDLTGVWAIRLFLYQPNQVKNVFEEVLPADSVSYIAGPETVHDQISWQHITGTSLETFYEIFHESNAQTCFEFTME